MTTDLAFEIWLIKPNPGRQINPITGATSSANVELECLYRKKEDKIEMIDFLHLGEEVYIRKENIIGNLKRDRLEMHSKHEGNYSSA